MEAIAKYAYKAGSSSELSFSTGDLIKIIPYDKDWCRGRLNSMEGFVPKSYITEKPHNWYKADFSREKSEEYLLNTDKSGYIHPDGAFLIRPSENSPGDFSASVKYNDNVQHFKIFMKDDKYYIWTRPFESFNELVEYHRSNSISRTHSILLKDMVEDGQNSKVSLYQGAYDFIAEDESELGFRKGEILKIINNSDVDWWKAEKNNEIGLVPAKYLIPLENNKFK